MNYAELRELLGMLENYGAEVEFIDIYTSHADVYFKTNNREKYENFLNLWSCDMHESNDSYVRFYLTSNKSES